MTGDAMAIDQNMRNEAARLASLLPPDSEIRERLREMAFLPGQLVDEQEWLQLVHDALTEIEIAEEMDEADEGER
jgi:hypothetical protein